MNKIKWIIGILTILMMVIGAWFLSKFVFGILIGVLVTQVLFLLTHLHAHKSSVRSTTKNYM